MVNNERNIYENIRHLREDLDRRMDNMDRYGCDRVTELQRDLDTRFVEMERDTDQLTEEVHRRISEENTDLHVAMNSQITDAVTQSNSYTDKRIDKLIDAYFITSEAKKQK